MARQPTPWGRPTSTNGGGIMRPYIHPDRIARAMGEPPIGELAQLGRTLGCADCAALGHICRACRKARFEARYPPYRGVSSKAALGALLALIGVLVFVGSCVWRLAHG